jgi:hypothetical protein
MLSGRLADFTRELVGVGAKAGNSEAEFFGRDPGRCDGMGCIAKDKHPLAG